MTVYKILKYPQPILREKCTDITNFSDDFYEFCQGMVDTMYAFDGIGLAASQVGILKNLTVIDVLPYLENDDVKEWHGEFTFYHEGKKAEPEFPLIIVNPKITDKGAEIEFPYDGCLSFPGVSGGKTSRFDRLTVEAVNEHNEKIKIEASGIMSICLQHELDHLQGKLYIDRFLESTGLKEEEILDIIAKSEKDSSYKKKVKKLKPVNARNKKYDFI